MVYPLRSHALHPCQTRTATLGRHRPWIGAEALTAPRRSTPRRWLVAVQQRRLRATAPAQGRGLPSLAASSELADQLSLSLFFIAGSYVHYRAQCVTKAHRFGKGCSSLVTAGRSLAVMSRRLIARQRFVSSRHLVILNPSPVRTLHTDNPTCRGYPPITLPMRPVVEREGGHTSPYDGGSSAARVTLMSDTGSAVAADRTVPGRTSAASGSSGD